MSSLRTEPDITLYTIDIYMFNQALMDYLCKYSAHTPILSLMSPIIHANNGSLFSKRGHIDTTTNTSLKILKHTSINIQYFSLGTLNFYILPDVYPYFFIMPDILAELLVINGYIRVFLHTKQNIYLMFINDLFIKNGRFLDSSKDESKSFRNYR